MGKLSREVKRLTNTKGLSLDQEFKGTAGISGFVVTDKTLDGPPNPLVIRFKDERGMIRELDASWLSGKRWDRLQAYAKERLGDAQASKYMLCELARELEQEAAGQEGSDTSEVKDWF